MNIQATAPGRKKSIVHDGLGRLAFTGAKGREARMLYMLFEEVKAGNLGFWVPIMWAAQQDRLTKADVKCLERIVARVTKDFDAVVTGVDTDSAKGEDE